MEGLPSRLAILWARLYGLLKPHYESMGSQFPLVVRQSIEAGEWKGTPTRLMLEYIDNYNSIQEHFSER